MPLTQYNLSAQKPLDKKHKILEGKSFSIKINPFEEQYFYWNFGNTLNNKILISENFFLEGGSFYDTFALIID